MIVQPKGDNISLNMRIWWPNMNFDAFLNFFSVPSFLRISHLSPYFPDVFDYPVLSVIFSYCLVFSNIFIFYHISLCFLTLSVIVYLDTWPYALVYQIGVKSLYGFISCPCEVKHMFFRTFDFANKKYVNQIMWSDSFQIDLH